MNRKKADPRRLSLLLSDQMAYARSVGGSSACGYLADEELWTMVRARREGTYDVDVQGLTEGELLEVLDMLRERRR